MRHKSKLHNKIFNLFLSAILLLTYSFGVMTTPPVAEAGGVNPSLAIENVEGLAGGTVNVPLELTSAGNASGLSFELSYDATLLTYLGANNGALLDTPAYPEAFLVGSGANTPGKVLAFVANTVSPNDPDQNKPRVIPAGTDTLITLQFTVNQEAVHGQTSQLILNDLVIVDENLDTLESSAVNGQFSVSTSIISYTVSKAPVADPIWTVSVDKDVAAAGETVTVTISDTAYTAWATGLAVTGDSGATYEYTTLTAATGNAQGANQAGVYSFVMPTENVTIDFTADYTPLQVYLKKGSDPEILVHSYTRAEINEFAAANTNPIYYTTYDRMPAEFIGKAVSYVTLDQLTASATTFNNAVRFNDSECSIQMLSMDGWNTKLTWDYLQGVERKYHASIGDKYLDEANRTGLDQIVPAVLATTGWAGRTTYVDNQPYDSLNAYRFFYGQSAAEYGNGVLPTSAEINERSTANNYAKGVNKVIYLLPEDAPDTYTASVDSAITGGSLTLTPTVGVAGTIITVTATPDSGKQLIAGSLKFNDGISDTLISAVNGVYSFTLPEANVVVTAAFENTSSPSDKISLYLDKTSALAGEEVTAYGSGPVNTSIFIKVVDELGNVVVIEPIGTDTQGNYTYTFTLPNVTGDAVTVIAGTGNNVASATLFLKLTPPVLQPDTDNNVIGQSIDLAYTADSAWQAAINDVSVNGSALAANQYTITSNNLNIIGSAFNTPGDYTIVVKAEGYKDASVNQVIQPKLAPTLQADVSNNIVGQSIDLTFTVNADWQAAVSGITVNGAALTADQYTVTSGNLSITANAFTASGSYTIVVSATNYTDASVTQLILDTAPLLVVDITNNAPYQVIEIIFDDNASWREAISNVTVDNLSIAGKYTVSEGKLTLDNTVFTVVGNYEVKVIAAGYGDAIAQQTILSPCYSILPTTDSIYAISENENGIKMMTVNSGINGLKYFNVNIEPVRTNNGEETLVFVHLKNNTQNSLNASKADFDIVTSSSAGFNVGSGDVIKVYMVDQLTNALDRNPIIFQ